MSEIVRRILNTENAVAELKTQEYFSTRSPAGALTIGSQWFCSLPGSKYFSVGDGVNLVPNSAVTRLSTSTGLGRIYYDSYSIPYFDADGVDDRFYDTTSVFWYYGGTSYEAITWNPGLTAFVWFKSDAVPTGTEGIWGAWDTYGNNRSWAIWANSSGITGGISNTGSSTTVSNSAVDGTDFTYGTSLYDWYLAVLRFDPGSTAYLDLFANGERIEKSTATAVITTYGNSLVELGSQKYGSSSYYYFDGRIGMHGFSSHVFTDNQVQQLYDFTAAAYI